MRNSCEMRREAWGILKGKWFWRLLCVAALLQFITQLVNGVISGAFKVMSITSVRDYAIAKINAAQQGLSYSLPTMKAYYWMIGGFFFQSFITYIFVAIFAFGFMGLLLKVSRDDDNRWFADAFGGFARPLEVTWLLVLINALILLAVFAWGVVLGLAAMAVTISLGKASFSLAGCGLLSVAMTAAVFCALPVMYAYRQAWFVKNEHPEASAAESLRLSRRMMKGHKWQAFCLDFSYFGWMLLIFALIFCSVICGHIARRTGLVMGVLSFVVWLVTFWTSIKVILSMAVARVVFYRELQKDGSTADAGGEV